MNKGQTLQPPKPAFGRLTIIVLLIAGLLALGGCATEQVQPTDAAAKKEARGKFQEAVQFGSLGMHDEMIATLIETVRLDPDNMNYRMQLGNAYVLKKDYQNAEKTFLAVLEENKDYKPAMRELGRLAMRKQDWRKAIHYFNEDLNRPGTPMPHQVYNYLALSYYNLGMFKEAESEWLKAIDIRDHAAIRLNLGLAYRDQERFREARESLEKALTLDPKFAQAHYEIAVLYLKEKNNRKASTHFNEVLRLAPQSQWAQSSREYLKVLHTKL